MEITRIDQIAIAVDDLDDALAFYERAFGLRPSQRHVAEADGVEEAMLYVGDVAIQLLAPLHADSPVGRFLAKRGPGLHHLGFAVASVPDALAHLNEEGVELIDDEPRIGAGGHEIAFVHPRGTNGVLVELVGDDQHGPISDGDQLA